MPFLRASLSPVLSCRLHCVMYLYGYQLQTYVCMGPDECISTQEKISTRTATTLWEQTINPLLKHREMDEKAKRRGRETKEEKRTRTQRETDEKPTKEKRTRNHQRCATAFHAAHIRELTTCSLFPKRDQAAQRAPENVFAQGRARAQHIVRVASLQRNHLALVLKVHRGHGYGGLGQVGEVNPCSRNGMGSQSEREIRLLHRRLGAGVSIRPYAYRTMERCL